MKQIWENDKNPSFRTNFDSFGANLGHQNFFSKIWLPQSLDIMVSYHHVQYQKQLIIQLWQKLVTDGETNVEHPIIKKCFL